MSRKRSIQLVAGVGLTLALAACGSTSNAVTASSTAPAVVTEQSTLVGPGCDEYAAQVPTGAGSFEGMAEGSVVTAIANNPKLTTLNAAITGGLNPEVNMVDTLNDSEVTVFAAVDEAYSAVVADAMESFATSVRVLTLFTSYQIVPGLLAPENVVGTHPTLEGHDLPITGSGDDLTLHGATYITDGKTNINEAKVICGGIQTQNGTLYLVDSLLSPPVG